MSPGIENAVYTATDTIYFCEFLGWEFFNSHACLRQLTTLCETFETCTFSPRVSRFIQVELAQLPQPG